MGLAERPVRVESDALAVDVDLGCLLPPAADGLVGDPRVVSRHLGRFVVEQDPDDFLWDVAVDQPAGEGVPPLVRGQSCGLAVLVADFAVGEPTVKCQPGDWSGPSFAG